MAAGRGDSPDWDFSDSHGHLVRRSGIAPKKLPPTYDTPLGTAPLFG